MRHGVWRSLVARFVRDEEVAGSNPVTPTKLMKFEPSAFSCRRFSVCIDGKQAVWPLVAAEQIAAPVIAS